MIEKHVSWWLPICYYIGIIIIGLGLIQYIPAVTSVIYAEWDIFFDFLISSSITLLVGGSMVLLGRRYHEQRMNWGDGMVVTAGSWFLGMLISALPYYLSGNYNSYLDCTFDVMSGLTTTGLTLIRDLDHVSNGINMWRHLLTFVGGQGMVVLALTFLVKGTSGAYKMYVGEGKDEHLMPNAISTARYIWLISLIYLCLGTVTLWIAGIIAGLSVDRAFLHGLWIFMSAWSTGGFAPMSQSILYYHSSIYEIATMIFLTIGSFNFALHYAVLTGKREELRRDIEIISFTVTLTTLTIITTLGLKQSGSYADAMSLFRKGFYQLISAHTTTGFMTIYAKQFYCEWGDIALFAITVAMLFGGNACSTAGGFKGLRIGIIFNAFKNDIKQMVLPESTVSVQKIHHIKDVILEDKMVRSAFLIVTAYIATFAFGTLIGMLSGYPFGMAAFESASATGNVGLSIGLTSASMPAVLKVTYIIILWVGRLEFMSVLALGLYVARRVKKDV
ncbi:TrkH family potassium uptake protein [Mahella australiensis]|uniref:Cation transporter n=1 Tax=Mahella australiensis (strain DSM 15567 / CIP 107919 / 50-1 BON) TaxID=697281 RepID=F4A0C9_MAHA5|nr:potassium transporter TrkG [Mahella australiensis]AEE97990.1 cation transporter [Mahella australiensis 50-1 BON]